MKHSSLRIFACAGITLTLFSLGGCGATSALYSQGLRAVAQSPQDMMHRRIEQIGTDANRAVNEGISNTASDLGTLVTESIVKAIPPIR